VQFSVSPDWRVFLFAALVAVIAGILSGLGPALHVSKTDVSNALKGIPVRGRFRLPLRDILVGIELALCFVLVFGSILSVRALQKVLTMPLGIELQGRVIAGFDLGLARYSEAPGKAFQQRVLNQIKTLPGVISAAYGNSLPLSIDQSTTGIELPGPPPKRGRNVRGVTWYDISPGYLSTLGIPLLRGRDFDWHDDGQSRLVAIVNQTFAKTIMRTGDPVGKTFRSAFGGPRVLVVGLVQDGKYRSLSEAPRPALFRPILQYYNSTTTLIVRSELPASAVIQQIRKTIAGLDNQLPLYGTGSLMSMLGFALFPMQAAAVALSAFGLLAMVLAITGIHGLVAYAVAQRTRELGIRIAIGATPSDVLRVVLGRLSLLISAGLAAGFVLALGAGQILESVVYGASPHDPGLLVFVIILLLGAAALSCWKPALRALRTDPITALRYE
jgi:predicted permease